MPRRSLDPKSILKLRPPEGRNKTVFYDSAPSAPPMFGVRVWAPRNGGDEPARVFVVRYRTKNGTERLARLGAVGDLTLAQAREAARRVLVRVALGEDPVKSRRDAEGADRFEHLVSAYIESGVTRSGSQRSDKTQKTYGRMWRADVKGSVLGRKRPPEITARDVEVFLAAKAATAPVVADRLHALVRSTFRWALRKGRVSLDPTTALDRSVRARVRKRVLTDDEVKAVWNAAGSLGHLAGTAIRLLLLLATRLSETLKMRWTDLDLSSHPPSWTVPGDDRKGGRTHVVPLSPRAVGLLESLRPATGNRVHAFAGNRGGLSLLSNPQRLAAALRIEAGVSDLRLHDLRRTAAVGMAKAGVSTEIVSRILGHALPAGTLAITSEHYQTFDRFPEKAAALAAWAARVERIVTGVEAGAKVVSITAGRGE